MLTWLIAIICLAIILLFHLIPSSTQQQFFRLCLKDNRPRAVETCSRLTDVAAKSTGKCGAEGKLNVSSLQDSSEPLTCYCALWVRGTSPVTEMFIKYTVWWLIRSTHQSILTLIIISISYIDLILPKLTCEGSLLSTGQLSRFNVPWNSL